MSTLTNIQIGIATDFDSSSTPPASTDSEYDRRLQLANRAARKWAKEREYKWTALYVSTSLSTTADQSYVDLPADFSQTGLILPTDGYIQIGDAYYKIVSVHEKGDYNSTQKICWITGNPSQGYDLNISPTPTTAETIPLEYYSRYLAVDENGDSIEELTTATDRTKCPDYEYIVMDVLGQLFIDDDEGNKGIDFRNQSIAKLNQLLVAENRIAVNANPEIPDYAERRGFPALGR